MMKIVLASGNKGKIVELTELLKPWDLNVVAQSDLNVPEVAETGSTFIENAIIKARHAAKCTGLPAIADDSGLSVDYLGGEPGVYSARYAGKDASNLQRITKLLTELKGVPDEKRTAAFHCVLAVFKTADDPAPLVCEGLWQGRVLHAPCGDGGFGYDPIFYVPERDCSAAELEVVDKNKISHRGRAMEKLAARIESYLF